MPSSPREQNESIEQPKQPSPCANNCGFFSNEACSGFCSKCYQEQLERQRHEAADAKEESPEKEYRHASLQESVEAPKMQKRAAAVFVESKVPSLTTEPPRKSTPTRCCCCNKRVGLTGFTCKCGEVFCGKHRHPNAHKCTFDHRSAERALLARQNPVIQGDKLERL